jgi:alpha-amylase
LGDFVSGPYEARIRRQPGRVDVQLRRQGKVDGHPVTITKIVGLSAGSSLLEIEYLLENLPADRKLHFGVELNFSGMPSGADDRYFYDHERKPLGQLGTKLELRGAPGLGLIDEWLGLDIGLSANRPTDIWTFPLESVSQSEGGFEAVHQSVVVMPHWLVQADAAGRWNVALNLSIDTSLAESRVEKRELASVPVAW